MAGSPFWDILGQVLWTLPNLIVGLIGIIVAILRWRRHPPVSALIVASLGAMIVLSVSLRIATNVIIHGLNSGGWDDKTVGLYFGVIALIALPVRIVAWGMVLTALFGWRTAVQGAPPPAFQFSIRGLMIVTIVVALLCALGRGLVSLLGESAGVLVSIVDEVPIVICVLIGIWLAIARWSWHPRASQLALFGFGSSLAAICAGAGLQLWLAMTRNYDPVTTAILLSAVVTALGTLGWALILVAVFWRGPGKDSPPFAQAPE